MEDASVVIKCKHEHRDARCNNELKKKREKVKHVHEYVDTEDCSFSEVWKSNRCLCSEGDNVKTNHLLFVW